MKSSAEQTNLLSEKDKLYTQQLYHLEQWFSFLSPAFLNVQPIFRSAVLKKNMAFVIEELMYNFFYLTPNTRRSLIEFLKKSDFTQIFPQAEFPSLITVFDLQMQSSSQPLSVPQTDLWEHRAKNVRLPTIVGLGNRLIKGQIGIPPKLIREELDKMPPIAPIPLLKENLKRMAVCLISNTKSFELTPKNQEIVKNLIITTEETEPTGYKDFYNFKASEIKLTLSTPWYASVFNWWNRDSIEISQLTLKVLTLCELAAEPSILSLKERDQIQTFLSQIKQQILAQKPNWLSRKLGLNKEKSSQLDSLEARIIKVERLLKLQSEQPTQLPTAYKIVQPQQPAIVSKRVSLEKIRSSQLTTQMTTIPSRPIPQTVNPDSNAKVTAAPVPRQIAKPELTALLTNNIITAEQRKQRKQKYATSSTSSPSLSLS